MRFVGLSATEFTLLFTSAAFLALVFYLISFRRRTAVLAAEPIWRLVLGRRRTPFRKLLALLVQILVLFLLSLVLADPRLHATDAQPPVAQLMVVDVSASMGALEDDQTRLELAVELVSRVAEAMGPRDRMMLVAMDDGCRPLTAWVDKGEQIQRALKNLETGAVAEDFEGALRFAYVALHSEAIEEDAERRVVVISDRFHQAPVGEASFPVQQVVVGEPGDNLAVTAFELRRRGGAARGSEVFVEVTNYGKSSRKVRLNIHTASELLGEDLISVPGRGSQARSYFLKPIADDRVMATITGTSGKGLADRFQLDDRAFALVPRRESRSVLLVTEGNLFIEKALQLDPTIDVRVVKPAAFAPDRLAGHQAVVFDGVCTAVDVPAIFFDPKPGPACPFTMGETVEFPSLQPLRGDHPVTESLSLIDVQIQLAHRLIPTADDVELLADGGGPLVLARESGPVKQLAFGFDVARSDLPLRIAFPMMIHNCLVWFLGAGVDMGAQEYVVGGLARLPDWVAASSQIRDPRGHQVAPLTLGGRALLKLRWPGFYEVSDRGQGFSVPANFQLTEESGLAGDRAKGPARELWAGRAADELPSALLAGFDKDIPPEPPLQWPLVLLAAAWLLLFDWVFFCFRILF